MKVVGVFMCHNLKWLFCKSILDLCCQLKNSSYSRCYTSDWPIMSAGDLHVGDRIGVRSLSRKGYGKLHRKSLHPPKLCSTFTKAA